MSLGVPSLHVHEELLEYIVPQVYNCGRLILLAEMVKLFIKLLPPALSQYGEFPLICFMVQYKKYLLLLLMTLSEIRGLTECFNEIITEFGYFLLESCLVVKNIS